MVKKSEFIWNSIASFISALLSGIILIICTRLNGVEIAGMFSIAYATATILNSIGDFGIRIYQVTDTERKYKFGEYFALRIVVVSIMLFIGIVFVFASGYETIKLVICILLILFRFIDNLSETFQGEFQLNNRLDLGAKSVILRNILSILVFFIIDKITGNSICSFIGLTLTNLIIFYLFDLRLIRKYTDSKLVFNKDCIKCMLKECFPVFLATILSVYLTNAVKYAIDNYGDYEMQTYYNILYMPAFTINLASMFILKPILKTLGDLWNNRNIKKINKITIGMSGIIMLFTIVVIIVCILIGIQILNFLYGVNLFEYKLDLIILVMSGGFYALSILELYVLTAIRQQRNTVIAYGITSIIALILPNVLVNKFDMIGATISNLIINVILFIILIIMYIIFSKNKIKE
ncbi:MAG: lipopolysaccharide biosynthesis protein [Candidatus Scatovivens sp.]